MKKATKINHFLARLFVILALFSAELLNAGEILPWESRGLENEISGKRTRTSKHFLRPDGSITAFMAAGSIHYRAAAGTWEEIDNTITTDVSATHPYVSRENAVQTFFPADPATGDLLMVSPDGTFRERVKAIRIVDASGATLKTLLISTPSQVQTNQNRITYSNVVPGVDLVYALGNDSRKFELVINSPAFLKNLPANAAGLAIDEEVTIPGNATLKNGTHGISFAVGNTEVIGIAKPAAYDASGAEPVNAFMDVQRTGNLYVISSIFDVQWMSSGQRSFPLHLDPTVNYYPQSFNFWTGHQTTAAGKTNGYLRLAAAGTTAWSKFDISALPAAAIVQGATFYGYHYTTNTVTKYAEARSMTVDPVTATAAQIYSEATGGTLYNTSFLWGTTTYSWQNASLNNAGISDIMAAKSQGWFAIGFAFESGSTTFQYLYGWNAPTTTPNYPYLEITYVTTPCTGIPPGNAIISPTFMLCPGENFLFELDSFYSVSGLTYQWQVSTISSVGPFTPAIGATQESFLATNIQNNSWYNLVVTCSNSTGTVLVSGGVVTVQAVVTSTAPYSEDFEGIGLPDRLPNCSWSAPNLGVSANTYVGAGINNLLPRSGTGFAAFTNPGGTDYYYTNGIYLYPGITYSASLWYLTDLTGATNWSDLSILIGTAQNPAGLVPIASTGGPAVAIVHKSLSNTFSVSGAGFYYIAVRATGSAGTAPHLAWDDLLIEIPCSLNTPSLNLLTTNTLVCAGDDVIITATGADMFTWNNNAGQGNVVTVNPLLNTMYTVVGTHSLTGCSAAASQFITVNPSPVVSVLSTPPFACANEPVTLHAFGADTYLWAGSGAGPTSLVIPAAGINNYTVQGVNQYGCTDDYVYQLTASPAPLVNAIYRGTICIGESVTLTGSGASKYQWKSNTVYVNDNPAEVWPQVTTQYTLVGSDANGCTGTDEFAVIVEPCTGLDQHGTTGVVQVYPNPTSGDVQILVPADAAVSLTDVSGRVLLNKMVIERANLNLSEIAAGVYYLRVNDGGSTKVIKLIRD